MARMSSSDNPLRDLLMKAMGRNPMPQRPGRMGSKQKPADENMPRKQARGPYANMPKPARRKPKPSARNVAGVPVKPNPMVKKSAVKPRKSAAKRMPKRMV